MEPIQVAVLDEHEIFRRGVVACLEEQPGLAVAVEAASGPVEVDVDVAFASAGCAAREALPCPVVVYAPQPAVPEDARVGNRVMGVLAVDGLTPDRLAGAARAAAAGLEVRVEDDGEQDLDPRSLAILRLLADGADTRRIANELDCSPRTVKNVISRLQGELGARNRAEAVAKGIRRGLI